MNDPGERYLRSDQLLSRGDSRLLVVDVQEKLIPLIEGAEQTIFQCGRLIRAADLLGVPVFATEQYPRGLGSTVKPLADLLGERPDKKRFSCGEVLDWGTAAEVEDDRDKVVVCGIETHVCVLQTVFDLLSAGFPVYVVADAVNARGRLDHDVALERMRDGGATVCTSESVLFEWCETADAAEFKAVSALVQESG